MFWETLAGLVPGGPALSGPALSGPALSGPALYGSRTSWPTAPAGGLLWS